VGSHETYVSNRDLIETSLGCVCSRERLSSADAEDFCSAFRLHLMANDYAVLAAFQGRSTLRTYLLTVVSHFYQDWRNARWGRWRPSAEARRLGPLAVQLETLLVRDGFTLDHAFETLRTNFGVTESRESLEALAARFPQRLNRNVVPEETLDQYPASSGQADAPLRQREAGAVARGAAATLAAAMASLGAQDRLILHMRFEDNFSVGGIARALHLEQKPLYRRIERLLADLRAALEASGLTAASAREVLEARGFDALAGEADEGLHLFDTRKATGSTKVGTE
jgi:RNA polymerase sigma factor for flagellar operon FliA